MISHTLRAIAAVLFLITFIMFLGKKCTHSPLFRYFNTKEDMLKRARQLNNVRYQLATDYFNTLKPFSTSEFRKDMFQGEKLDIAVVIVTVARTERSANDHNGYLVQTAAWMDKLLKMNLTMRSMLIVCNAETEPERHRDAKYLQKYMPYINREGSNLIEVNLRHKHTLQNSTLTDMKRRREIEDYVFCLNASRHLKSEYKLVIEDDVLPEKDMLQVVEHTLTQRFKLRRGEWLDSRNRFAFIKLYYPEKWQGFAFEGARLVELCCVGFVGGMVVTIYFNMVYTSNKNNRQRLSVKIYALCITLCLAFEELVGRITLMGLRRASPWLYKVGPSPIASTPAMLYQSSVLEPLIDFLLVNASKNKDLAIHDFSVKSEDLAGYQLEPNLFRHTGMYTSLYAHAKPKDAQDYIFDIPFDLTAR